MIIATTVLHKCIDAKTYLKLKILFFAAIIINIIAFFTCHISSVVENPNNNGNKS